MRLPGMTGPPRDIKINPPREMEEDHAGEAYKKAQLLRFFVNGFVFRLKGEIQTRAKPALQKLLIELAKLLRLFPKKDDYDSSDDGDVKKDETYLFRYLIAGFKSLQMRIKLKLGDAEAFIASLLEEIQIKFGDVYDLVDAVGMIMVESKFLLWYDNVPWVHELVGAIHDLAFADMEIGLVHKNFTSSLRIVTCGIQELFDSAMQNMELRH